MFLPLRVACAGDDASGPVPFRVDLSQPFTTYSMTIQDKLWSASLATRFVYKGGVVHFVRTSIPLQMGEKTLQGSVYQAVEKPKVFYVVNGDAMLKVGTSGPTTPALVAFPCMRRSLGISLFASTLSMVECRSYQVHRCAQG